MSAIVLVLTVLLLPFGAWAHPGRLDAQNCHEVRTRFVYRSGRVAEVGEAHCHRKLGEGMRLDGREVLGDAEQDRQDAEGDDRRRQESR